MEFSAYKKIVLNNLKDLLIACFRVLSLQCRIVLIIVRTFQTDIYPRSGCLFYLRQTPFNRGEVVRFVKVRAYVRTRFGKLEKVRSHYRRYSRYLR